MSQSHTVHVTRSLIRTSPPLPSRISSERHKRGCTRFRVRSGRALNIQPLSIRSPFPSRAHLHPAPLEPFPPLPILGVGARFKTRITYTKGVEPPFRYYLVGRVTWKYNVSRFKGKNSDFYATLRGHPLCSRGWYCRDRWEKRERVHCVEPRWLMEVRCRQVE